MCLERDYTVWWNLNRDRTGPINPVPLVLTSPSPPSAALVAYSSLLDTLG